MNKRIKRSLTALWVCLFFAGGFSSAAQTSLNFPIEYYKLPNGLKVVLSQDKTAPVALVGIYYNIGFRIEPRSRTGFAHLFEHLMFQGSKNLGKMEFIKLVEDNGGVLNGSTRFDFTNYYEIIPSNTLETILWAEADRMKGLDISQDNLTNQQGVVKNEVKVNVLNRPYGGFPWLDMPQYANRNWYNSHNFYGDLKDIDAATLSEASEFFKTYYAPNNAVLSICGDFDIPQTKAWIGKYFGNIPSVKLPPKPDLSEPRQNKDQRFTKVDSLANKPAIAVAYKMPGKNTPEYFAMGLIDQLLVQGKDSKLYQYLVQDKGYTSVVNGGINYLGNMFDYNGPMLWMADFIYDPSTSPDSIMAQFNKAVNYLNRLPESDLKLAKTKMRSSLYDLLGSNWGFGRMDLLASYALFDNNPEEVNKLVSRFDDVTPEMIKKTVKEYLRPGNRTTLIIQPASKSNPK
ncbi:MAG: insulinase family protein [Chitinophagaceae bacterium]|nr:insulinase family protein [Chitinophagaceae bacterium]